MKQNFCFTIDVDYFPGSSKGIEKILFFLKNNNLKATFFIATKYLIEFPDDIIKIMNFGHEIGCHGYSHGLDWEENFKYYPYDKMLEKIKLSRKWFDEYFDDVISFRAPYGWIAGRALSILEKNDFRIDSSINAIRYDFGIGISNDMRSLFSPRYPYNPAYSNPYQLGSAHIKEIPISNYFLAFNFTSLRLFGLTVFRFLYLNVRRNFNTINFYVHPWELLSMDEIKMGKSMPFKHKINRGDQGVFLLNESFKQIIKDNSFKTIREICQE